MAELAGAKLKKIRQELGLTLEEAHKKTKIHLNILRAIEEDNLIGTSPVYIKGFLKIYCKFLGVEPKDYIAGYQEPQSTVKEKAGVPRKPITFLKTSSLKLISFRGINIKAIFIVIFILFLSVSLFSLGKFISSKKRKIPTTKLEKTQKIQTISAKAQQPDATTSKNKGVLTAIRLGIRAKEDCWVHLALDGRVVFHTILKKGKFESWQAKERMELSLGNSGAIELELNGRIIPPLGRRGQAIKNILITKEEGLVVRR